MRTELHTDGSKLEPEETKDLHRVRIRLGEYDWLDIRERDGVIELYASGVINIACVASNRTDLTISR